MLKNKLCNMNKEFNASIFYILRDLPFSNIDLNILRIEIMLYYLVEAS